MRNTFQYKAVFLLTVFCGLFFAPIVQAVDLHQIREAGPPEITDEGILFTYKPEKRTPKYVMVSGSFDNWESLHMMTKNHVGVYTYLYDDVKDYTEAGKRGVIVDRGVYDYRYLIDGLWVTDPLNNRSSYDKHGTELSQLTVKVPIIKRQKNPIHIAGSRYIFYLVEPNARSVYLIGDFNNWNPYSHPMKRNDRGWWEIEIDLPHGDYSYRFIVDGKHRVDPMGRNIRHDRFNRELTKLLIPLDRMIEKETPGILQLQ
jgi:1,4-alpha-glucan branching enzyme